MQNELIENLDKIHTTPLGEERIKRNCCLECENERVIEWCKARISEPETVSARYGKNFYAACGKYIFTVNATSFTIITAHIRR